MSRSGRSWSVNIRETLGALETLSKASDVWPTAARLLPRKRCSSARSNFSAPIEVSHFDGAIRKWDMRPMCRLRRVGWTQTSDVRRALRAGGRGYPDRVGMIDYADGRYVSKARVGVACMSGLFGVLFLIAFLPSQSASGRVVP